MERDKQIEEMAKDLEATHDYEGCEAWHCGGCEYEKYGKNHFCSSIKQAEHLTAKGYRKIPNNIGEFSDGYHTFNELYHHRAILFSIICNMMPEKAWKSKLHDTGDMYDGMFIVGIETEQGQATYHYDIEPYWNMFKVKELDKAPKWDGHTPSEAIQRIYDMSTNGYRKASEVAKEIFADLEKWLAIDGNIRLITAEKFAEIKKRYERGNNE